MDMRGYSIDPFDTLDSLKVSVPSPLSEYILNSNGSESGDGVLTPTDNATAAKSDVTVSSNGNSSGELTEEKLKQIKRAQNRAAQRAFRERKETRLKELEQELRQSEARRKQLDEELERLCRANLEMNAENKILLEQGEVGDYGTQGGRFTFPHEIAHENSGSLQESREYSSKIFKTEGHYLDESGKEILTVPATWDYLHQLSEQVQFNVTGVLDSLKGNEVCHGLGAAYPRVLVDQQVREQLVRDASRA